jgi:hypothetical protein
MEREKTKMNLVVLDGNWRCKYELRFDKKKKILNVFTHTCILRQVLYLCLLNERAWNQQHFNSKKHIQHLHLGFYIL